MAKASKRKNIKKKIETAPIKVEKTDHVKDTFYENFIYMIIIAILFLGVYGFIFDKKLDLNGDNAYYYMLGKALSQGEGYVNIADINKSPNNHYPPGYPFILSLFMTHLRFNNFFKTDQWDISVAFFISIILLI